ncbi:MAG: adenine deaminase [Lachnospiraceae bacterium]
MKKMVNDIAQAFGEKKAKLVLKNARVVNVFTKETENADVAISNGKIVGIGDYQGEKEVDLKGKYVCPGFMDGHIHIESSMVSPFEFERITIVHGTCGCFVDPHELANVAGLEGIQYILDMTAPFKQDIYVMLPSCVPATDLDESGAVLSAEELKELIGKPRVKGLAELMNAFGTVRGDKDILDKIIMTKKAGKVIDGHAPFLSGKELNAYVYAGAASDHECSNIDEAMEKLRRGQWIMIREGTAAHNMEALSFLFKEPYCNRAMFATDDKHPGDILELGHIDYLLKKAVSLGAKPEAAVAMATINPATYFGCKGKGAVAPGYDADLVIVEDLKDFKVCDVYKNGELVVESGRNLILDEPMILKYYPGIFNSFNMEKVTTQSLQFKDMPEKPDKIRVVQLIPHELITDLRIGEFKRNEGFADGVDVENDIVKIAVFERHNNTGHVGLGFLGGYGLKKGAVATSVGHDSHNLVVVGVNDEDMVVAANAVIEANGGLCVASEGKVDKILPLEIGGLMSLKPAPEVQQIMDDMKELLSRRGTAPDIDPFMTLAFASLPVIPKLRVNTLGLIDVDSHSIVSTFL